MSNGNSIVVEKKGRRARGKIQYRKNVVGSWKESQKFIRFHSIDLNMNKQENYRLLLHTRAAKVATFKEWLDRKAKKYKIENIINIFFEFCKNPTDTDAHGEQGICISVAECCQKYWHGDGKYYM